MLRNRHVKNNFKILYGLYQGPPQGPITAPQVVAVTLSGVSALHGVYREKTYQRLDFDKYICEQ